MDLFVLENWHVLRLVTIGLLVAAFVLFAALVRAVQFGTDRRRKSRRAANAGQTIAAAQSPRSWEANGTNARLERRAA